MSGEMANKELTEDYRVMPAVGEANRSCLKLIGVFASIALLWIAFSWFIVPAIIRSAYHGESLPFLNSIISGQAIHPLEHYLTNWETISWRVLGMMFVVGLIPLPLVATRYEVQVYLEDKFGDALSFAPGILNTALALLGLTFVFYLYYLHPVGYVYFTTDDYWGEHGTFVSWAMACCFLTCMIIKDREARKPAVVLLALGTFFLTMEEISWGQRMIGLSSPAWFAEHNLQRETSLHNLLPFATERYVVAGIATFLWSILLPLLARKWDRLRVWFDKVGIPIVDIHLWPLFLLASFYLTMCALPRCDEAGELFLSIAIVTLSLDLVLAMRRAARPRAFPTIAATVGMMLTVVVLTAFLTRYYDWPRGLKGSLNVFAETVYPEAGMYPQAEMLFEYINQHPQFSRMETHVQHGALLMRMGEYAKAKETLEIAFAEQKRFQNETPDDPEPYRNAGWVLALLGRHKEAQGEFRDALEKDRTRLERATDAKNEAWIRWSLGKTFLASGDSEAASVQFAMARAIAPDRRTQYEINERIRANRVKESLTGSRDSRY